MEIHDDTLAQCPSCNQYLSLTTTLYNKKLEATGWVCLDEYKGVTAAVRHQCVKCESIYTRTPRTHKNRVSEGGCTICNQKNKTRTAIAATKASTAQQVARAEKMARTAMQFAKCQQEEKQRTAAATLSEAANDDQFMPSPYEGILSHLERLQIAERIDTPPAQPAQPEEDQAIGTALFVLVSADRQFIKVETSDGRLATLRYATPFDFEVWHQIRTNKATADKATATIKKTLEKVAAHPEGFTGAADWFTFNEISINLVNAQIMKCL
ncbi:TPA: hypothetical protein QH074_004327 [Enterobacter hormaechei subsp. steigerwaltii]|nr:hypothetical protein [Enterobacter hormaechei subsp. steigerwaltii]